jgi:hypothetical protein
MIILGSITTRGTEGTVILEDAFTGATLDTGEWTAADFGTSSAVTQNNELILTGTVAEVSYARVVSTTEIPTTGVVKISVDWTPGKKYISATGCSYIALVQASPTRETASGYGFPYTSSATDACVTIKLGADGDTVSRTDIGCGLFNSTLGDVIGHAAHATGLTCNENTQYKLELEINWDVETLSFWLDDAPEITDQTFSYMTPTGAYYLELAYCDYGAASNVTEKFDNLVVTTY